MNDYDERRGLLDFVPPNFLPIKVLLIDSEEFLPALKKILPAAQIYLLDEPNLIEKFPCAPKIFEIIIAKDVLTVGEDFYSKLLAMNHLLTDSGMLLTQFYNVRFIKVLENLRRGRFMNNEQRFWAKADVVRLLDDAIYKEIHFLPGEREFSADEWEKFGFENFNEDLTTKIWLVQAFKCTAEVAALKDVFTPEIRADLSRFLHRIEYNIAVEENFQRMMNLCDREGIFDEYLSDFINQVVVHVAAKKFIQNRAKNFGRTLDLIN